MKVKKTTTDKVSAPAGTHICLLTQIIDYGTMVDSFGARRKVELIWELPEETHVFKEENGEQPFIIDRKFAMKIGKGSALRECLVGLTGVDFEDDEIDLEEYLLTVGTVSLQHKKDGEYTNVVHNAYAPIGAKDPRAKKKFKAEGLVGILDLDNFDEEFFKQLPSWKQEQIKKSPEYKAAVGGAVAQGEEEEQEEKKPTKAKAPVKKAEAPVKGGSKAGKLFK